MPDDSDDRREQVTKMLQEMGPPRDEDDSPHGAAMCTGWVFVVEWMDETGERWLSRGWAASKAKWEADGMMHEALYGDW